MEEVITVVHSSSPYNREQLMKVQAKQIREFVYEADENYTFGFSLKIKGIFQLTLGICRTQTKHACF